WRCATAVTVGSWPVSARRAAGPGPRHRAARKGSGDHATKRPPESAPPRGRRGPGSVEAVSRAPNPAPVPRGKGRQRNSARKAVLIGLANHAGPDGTGAFPSVRTLVRYTDLSERTVRTALDRLEAEGIIRPCDPAIIAAKIKRPDQRPQGWDLAIHR